MFRIRCGTHGRLWGARCSHVAAAASSPIVDADTRHERGAERSGRTRRDATLIYHASTYDVDGSRTLRDKTDRRQLAVAVRELSRDRTHRCLRSLSFSTISPLCYFTRETNKTRLINKCITIYRACGERASKRTSERTRAASVHRAIYFLVSLCINWPPSFPPPSGRVVRFSFAY